MNEERGISAAFGEEVKIIEVVKTVEVIEEVEVVKEDEVIKYIERPRPEVKEMCIQTDELVHTTPPRTSVPISVTPSGQAEHLPSHPLPYHVAYIEGIHAVLDPNPMPPGLYKYSIVISTLHREMKITTPTRERHEIWLNAFKYLLSRLNPTLGAPGEAPGLSSPVFHATEFTHNDHRHLDSSPQSQCSGRSSHNGGTFSTTPKGKWNCSQLSVRRLVGKRSGMPAAEYLDVDFKLHRESKSDEGYEGLENICACCDGRYTVGHVGYHHHHPCICNGDHLDVNAPVRPVSPALSLRSCTGSAHSCDTGGFPTI
ncbi:hypothetical protein SCLCIDRAFT_28205 [Scleroderma citrinum Foug A]|uniref:Pleckstrin homology domain-containing protein n=1 Tax=Scleroderma citrinum Foug A TaxID=1036808 RepID=A0A0C3DC66_9AGAM|nr:hypothetical protein SCLCIDRAFT_28205 [Scleroderma citrinum Foug A]